ncbi:hypothetical protein ACKWTF_001030 [Chironomus riparius]
MIQSLITIHHTGFVWHHMAKIICIVPKSFSFKQRLEILTSFMNYGFLDVALVFKDETRKVKFEVLTSLNPQLRIGTDNVNASSIFPEKLKDMDGYKFRIVISFQPPRVKLVNRRFSVPLVHFLVAVKKARNSNFKIIFLKDFRKMKEFWLYREMDLTLNSPIVINNSEPKLLTYEEDAQCVLVPLPIKTSLFQLIIVKPFDGLTWLFLMLTIVASVTVWWLFQNRGAINSSWLLAYAMIVMFMGQGVEFSRKNRLVLIILLQVIIIMMFVMSTAYESVISSFMIKPLHSNRLKTFDDVLVSKYDVLIEPMLFDHLNFAEKFKNSLNKIVFWNNSANNIFIQRVLEHKHALIVNCDYVEYKISSEKQLLRYYYLLPVRLVPSFIRLEASFLNPYIQMLQNLMDLCFEAGLPQIWKLFEFFNDINIPIYKNYEEQTYLKLKDLVQVFSILIIGSAISLLVFLIFA